MGNTSVKYEANDTCEFCAERLDHASPWLVTDEVAWYKNAEFSLTECGNCGLIVATRLPDRYAIYQSYLEAGRAAKSAFKRKRGRTNVVNVHEKRLASVVELYKEVHGRQPSSVYDMGFGAGTMFDAAERLGLERFGGNEINLSAINEMNAAFGGKGQFTHGFSRDISGTADWDLVINFDFLEHSYEPYHDLGVCNALLKDGGLLYLKTLYMDNPDHLLKGDCYQLFGQGHFHYFRVRTLLAMIANAGFKILKVQLGPLVFVYGQKVGEPAARDRLDLRFLNENYNYLRIRHRQPHGD